MHSKIPEAGHHVTLGVHPILHRGWLQGRHTLSVTEVQPGACSYARPAVHGGAQVLQRVCPVVFAYVPEEQFWHPVLAIACVEKVPAEHAWQCEAPLVLVCVPEGQAVHEETPSIE